MEQAQFADQLFALERLHFTKLMLWSGVSMLAASLLFTWLRVRRSDSPLLHHFGLQCFGWGILELGYATLSRRMIEMRDFAGATLLDRQLWFSIGLDAGVVLGGVAVAVIGWRLGRRLGLVGAGLGVVLQGLALGLLNLQLSAGILR